MYQNKARRPWFMDFMGIFTAVGEDNNGDHEGVGPQLFFTRFPATFTSLCRNYKNSQNLWTMGTMEETLLILYTYCYSITVCTIVHVNQQGNRNIVYLL